MNILPPSLAALLALSGPAAAEVLSLTVSTDAPCVLLLNDQPAGNLAPGSPRTVEAAAGETTVGCLSIEHPAAMATRTVIGSGSQSVAFSPAATWARFTSDGSGWLSDAATGLRWHTRGSADELGWSAAGEWCRSIGGRLPSREELGEMHVHGQDRSYCGDGIFCGIPHQITLGGRFVWTREEFEGDQAIINGLAGQKPSAQSVPKDQTSVRALCVAP